MFLSYDFRWKVLSFLDALFAGVSTQPMEDADSRTIFVNNVCTLRVSSLDFLSVLEHF